MALKAEDSVLVVIDVQGRLATLMHRKEEFFENLVKMIRGAQVLGIPILWNEQLPDKLGSTIPEIRDVLAGQAPLIKSTFSCCGSDDFARQLGSLNRNQVLLVGMETHVCVYQTARDLLAKGYEVHLVADCVSSRTPENKKIGIDAIKDCGAGITSLEMALFEMLHVAEGDEFKRIIEIVK
ncbi:MAG TPA: hydrolase [Acidobacteriota bacterium]|nr:hydrolase [Acidobacteriota bacterium]